MAYDALDRLTTANAPGIWGTAGYAYDALDNVRTSVVGSRSSAHNYDAANRLSSINTNGVYTAYAYDGKGNVTARGSLGLYFDQGNRMTLANGLASYIYDGFGGRTSTIASNGDYRKEAYGQSGPLLFGQKRQGMVMRNTRYLYLGGKLIAEDGTAGVQYVHTDALGSPVARTNASAGLVSRTRYEAYGNTAAGTVPSGVGFTGHVNDADTGLVYMQQRYYDPVAGRFQSVDPVTANADTGSTFNRYVYASNSPYVRTDPDGRSDFCGSYPCTMIGSTAKAVDKVITGGYGLRAQNAWNIGDYGDWGLNIAVGAAYGAMNVATVGQAGALLGTGRELVAVATESLAAKAIGPIAGGGARLESLTAGEIGRIQNAANRTGTEISVVGSRASGTAGATSDWDYVVSAGTKASTVHSLKSSLPEGARGLGEPRNQDFFRGAVDSLRPFITFTPR